MNSIKEGDLVKAWDDDPSDFVVGKLEEICDDGSSFFLICGFDESDLFCNVAKIPDELAKQLEGLE